MPERRLDRFRHLRCCGSRDAGVTAQTDFLSLLFSMAYR